jgi:hypothetical protein
MAITDQIGTDLAVGATTTLTLPNATNYTVVSCSEGDKQIDFEDVVDADGKLMTRLVFNRFAKLTLELICKSAAAPATDFVTGSVTSLGTTPNDKWYIDSAVITKTKSATKVTVTATLLGLTA